MSVWTTYFLGAYSFTVLLLDCRICAHGGVLTLHIAACRCCNMIAVIQFFCRSLRLVHILTLILLPRSSSERLQRTSCTEQADTRRRISMRTCGASGDFPSWKRPDCLRRRSKPSHTATVTASSYVTSSCGGFSSPTQIGACHF